MFSHFCRTRIQRCRYNEKIESDRMRSQIGAHQCDQASCEKDAEAIDRHSAMCVCEWLSKRGWWYFEMVQFFSHSLFRSPVPSFAFMKVSSPSICAYFHNFPQQKLNHIKKSIWTCQRLPCRQPYSSSIVELSIVHEIAMRLKSFHINNSAEWLRMNKWVCVGRELTIFGDVLFCRWASETHPSDRFINVTNIKNLYSGEKTNWFRLRFKH